MKKSKLFYLKNGMLGANFIANFIFLSTDGVWEARNKKGEMLGKEPILNAIRQNSSSDATQIIDAIFDILDKFIGEVKIEDDITSVIIKMQD